MKIATGKKGSNPILRRWRKGPFILDRICQTCPSNKGFKTLGITISTGYLQPSNRQTRSTAKLRWRKVARATPAWLSRWPEWFSSWFQIFFMFTPIWGWFSFCLILFEGVETTNSFFFFMLFCLMTSLRIQTPRIDGRNIPHFLGQRIESGKVPFRHIWILTVWSIWRSTYSFLG